VNRKDPWIPLRKWAHIRQQEIVKHIQVNAKTSVLLRLSLANQVTTDSHIKLSFFVIFGSLISKSSHYLFTIIAIFLVKQKRK
jgi:hypothetical protein